MTGCGGSEDSSRVARNQCSCRMSSRSSWQTAQLMPSRTISEHPIPRLRDLGDDLREHVLDAPDARRVEPDGGPVGQGHGEGLVELLPAFQDRLIELLIRLREAGDLLAPADRFPCPIDEGQFLAGRLGELGE